MLCNDPGNLTGSWALNTDGGVDTADGALFLGSLAGNRWGWQSIGTLWGIVPWWDGAGWGYKIAIRLTAGLAPDGGNFDYYRFPSNASLNEKLDPAAQRYEMQKAA